MNEGLGLYALALSRFGPALLLSIRDLLAGFGAEYMLLGYGSGGTATTLRGGFFCEDRSGLGQEGYFSVNLLEDGGDVCCLWHCGVLSYAAKAYHALELSACPPR